jgi:hypothetical protein
MDSKREEKEQHCLTFCFVCDPLAKDIQRLRTIGGRRDRGQGKASKEVPRNGAPCVAIGESKCKVLIEPTAPPPAPPRWRRGE